MLNFAVQPSYSGLLPFKTFGLIVFLLFAGACSAPETETTEAELYVYEHEETVPEGDAEVLETLGDTGILFWTPGQQLAGYRNTPKVSPVRILEPAANPYPLPDAPAPVATQNMLYSFDGDLNSYDDYITEMNVAGLLVLKDGEVLLEEYYHGNKENTTWISFSVTKSVLSMLFGAALQDGHIESPDEEVIFYLPALSGTAYDGVTIEHLLQMSSGVAWDENYEDEHSDVAQLEYLESEEALIDYLSRLPRAAEPGTRFNYNTAETNLAGAVLQAAVGQTLTEYATEVLWQGFGMEHGASWALMGPEAIEHGGCCISASLRDYARIGLISLQNLNTAADAETAILPADWMQRSTQPAETYEDYGYFWWLQDDDRFAASGIFGQHIHINPEENLVIALQSFWPEATGTEFTRHRQAFINSLTDAARNASLSSEECCSEQ